MPGIESVGFNRLPEIAKQLPQAVSAVVRKTAFEIQAEAVRQMEASKSGHWYGAHQASAPDEAPAIDTGYLANSLATLVDPSGATAYVYTNAEYAAVLEFGGAQMEKRPFLGPAAEKARPGFEQALTQLEERLK